MMMLEVALTTQGTDVLCRLLKGVGVLQEPGHPSPCAPMFRNQETGFHHDKHQLISLFWYRNI
jgi:hypothetical protein